MTTVEILEKTRALIDNPNKWTQMASAKDAKQLDVSYSSPSAVCWCLTGAIYKCSYDRGSDLHTNKEARLNAINILADIIAPHGNFIKDPHGNFKKRQYHRRF